MAAPATGSIIRVPARLVWNPTNLGAAEPYGGTYLGTARDLEFIPQPQYKPIWAEEFGSYVDAIYCGEKVLFKAVLRYPDSDAITQTAPKAVASGSSGIRFVFRPGGTTQNTRAGTSMFSRAGKLLIAARARSDHPMLLMYNALPAFDEAARLQFSLGTEYGLAVAFWGTPDSSGRVYDMAQRQNLVL